MKQIITGAKDISLDGLSDAYIKMPLNGSSTNWINTADIEKRVTVIVLFTEDLTDGSLFEWRMLIGSSGINSRVILETMGSVTFTSSRERQPRLLFKGIPVGPSGSSTDTIAVEVRSNNAEVDIAVESIIYEMDDARLIGGEDVSLTNNKLDVNVGLVGGATPLSAADIAAANWALVMENGKSYAEVMRVVAAALSGKSSIASGEITFTGIDGSTERLKVTVANGARTSVDTWNGST